MICNFCTIITFSHLHFAKALHSSLQKHNIPDNELNLYVLIVDINDISLIPKEPGIKYVTLAVLQKINLASSIVEKYLLDFDKLRWSFKPILLHYLIKKYNSGFIYLDSDLYFYNTYDFLFNYLNDYSIILSPHFRCIEPEINEIDFLKNFTEGIYNGGFIGASIKAIPALNWWATAVLYACLKDINIGLYDDQKYLDLLPALFPKIYSIEHEGCNIAAWNRDYCKRVKLNDSIYINEKYPIVFIHFTTGTSIYIKFGSDRLLFPYLLEYAATLDSYQKGIKYLDLIEQEYKKSLPKISISYRISNKILRVKKYFFNT